MFQLVLHVITNNETSFLPTALSIFQISPAFARKIQVSKIDTFTKLWIYSITLNFLSEVKFRYNCHYIFVIRNLFSKKIAWFCPKIFIGVAVFCMFVYLFGFFKFFFIQLKKCYISVKTSFFVIFSCFSFFLKLARAKPQYQLLPYPLMRLSKKGEIEEKKKKRKRKSARGDLKSSFHSYFPGLLTMFLVKKRLCKTKHGFEGSIANVDLGLFQPNNQY